MEIFEPFRSIIIIYIVAAIITIAVPGGIIVWALKRTFRIIEKELEKKSPEEN